MLAFIAVGAQNTTQKYDVLGGVDVMTYENTLFYWKGIMYNLENIPCKYYGHAGIWEPETYGNHSYARIRELGSGRVVVNISSTVKFGFITAFPDYENEILWLFGTPADRCLGNGSPETVQAWWNSGDISDANAWQTSLAFDYGVKTHNVQVTRVGSLPGAETRSSSRHQHPPVSSKLPPHRYMMMLEPFVFAINNNDDGNLTTGWTLINSSRVPAPSGGPSIRYNPIDGYYYILTGGHTVHLLRTRDFQTWTESNPSPFISPSEQDAQPAPFQGFPARASKVGSPPYKYVGIPSPDPFVPFDPVWSDNYASWDHNSNDGDICCMHADLKNSSYVIWGAGTQGGKPSPPLDGTDACVNVIATAKMPLYDLLASYFTD